MKKNNSMEAGHRKAPSAIAVGSPRALAELHDPSVAWVLNDLDQPVHVLREQLRTLGEAVVSETTNPTFLVAATHQHGKTLELSKQNLFLRRVSAVNSLAAIPGAAKFRVICALYDLHTGRYEIVKP